MLALISLSFFAQSGHIDAFRSIVGDAKGTRNLLVRSPPGRILPPWLAQARLTSHARTSTQLCNRYGTG